MELNRLETCSRIKRSSTIQLILATVVILLLTGPHLVFDEVRYFYACLFAMNLCLGDENREGSISMGVLIPVILLLWIGGVTYYYFERKIFSPLQARGFYEMERTGNSLLRWTSARAMLPLCGDFKREIKLDIRALHPDLAREPVQVVIREVENEESAQSLIILEDNHWKALKIPLTKVLPRNVRGNWGALEISVNRLWSPLFLGKGQDARWLGVIVRWPEEACS